jgi:low temperature requirement protein LtrA
MRGRDPAEAGRGATPLELLFDLTFVVAVAQAAAQLHHAISEGHIESGLLGYVMVFFAIWWAWMNFTWFASAYDTDDVPYRVLTLLQMGGVLVLAAGVPAAFGDYDFTVITIGYVIMRLAQVTQWLRAAAEHPAGRPAAARYAAGVTVVQILWVARLFVPHPVDYIGFAVLVVAEIAVPACAESRGRATSWHPGHISERYGEFSIIVLGEVITAILAAVQSGLSAHGISVSLLLIAVGGLILVFGLWWIYFTGAETGLTRLSTALAWGYGHYGVFAAIAGLGAGLEVALSAEDQAELSRRVATLAVAIPVAVCLLILAVLHRLADTGTVAHPVIVLAGAIVVVALAFSASVFGFDGAILGMGLAVAATLAVNLTLTARRTRSIPVGEP